MKSSVVSPGQLIVGGVVSVVTAVAVVDHGPTYIQKERILNGLSHKN